MWYVYVYKDPIDSVVFYVGKGQGNRHRSHLFRAKTWIDKGKPNKYGSINIHLMRKISQLWDNKLEPIVEILENYSVEEDAYSREIVEINNHRSERLCNIANGGEGLRACAKETIEKIKASRKIWLESEKGQSWRKTMSESRKGVGNPAYGKKEAEDHKIARMKNLLSKTRWNKGLRGDPRSAGHPKGVSTWNAKVCRITNQITGQIVEAESKTKLAKKLKEQHVELSMSSLSRALATGKAVKNWKVEYVTK